MRIETNADVPASASLKGTVVKQDKANVSYADKILYAWRLSEGQGTVVRDIVGSQDGVINGAAWESNEDYLDGQALSGDGVDDYVETTTLEDFGSTSLGGSHSISFTFKTSMTGLTSFIGCRDTSSTDFMILMSGEDANTGEITFWVTDGNDNAETKVTDDTYNDNSLHRCTINQESPTASGINIWIDGIKVNQSVGRSQGASNFSDLSQRVFFLARNQEGSVSRQYNGVLDNILIMSDSLTEREIKEDYYAQPWVDPAVENNIVRNY